MVGVRSWVVSMKVLKNIEVQQFVCVRDTKESCAGGVIENILEDY